MPGLQPPRSPGNPAQQARCNGCPFASGVRLPGRARACPGGLLPLTGVTRTLCRHRTGERMNRKFQDARRVHGSRQDGRQRVSERHRRDPRRRAVGQRSARCASRPGASARRSTRGCTSSRGDAGGSVARSRPGSGSSDLACATRIRPGLASKASSAPRRLARTLARMRAQSGPNLITPEQISDRADACERASIWRKSPSFQRRRRDSNPR